MQKKNEQTKKHHFKKNQMDGVITQQASNYRVNTNVLGYLYHPHLANPKHFGNIWGPCLGNSGTKRKGSLADNFCRILKEQASMSKYAHC